MAADLLVTNIAQLDTKDPGPPGLLGLVDNAAVVIEDGAITWVGAGTELDPELPAMEVLDCAGAAVVPGFVDSHTHLVFAGDRAAEFGRRLRGESYEQIMASGGGIRATVAATREASRTDLAAGAAARLGRMLASGTTTVEIKSGYGLDTDVEVRILDVAASLGDQLPVDVVPTFLGAHGVAPEFAGDADGYLDYVIGEMLPACAPRARFCDVFCDSGAFSVDQARRMLVAGREAGLGIRIHANQLAHSGGAALAAELGATSADHLDHLREADVAALRRAGTVAVLLPGVGLSLRTPQADARSLWDAGVPVALATDCNPGTSYVETMPFVVALGCLTMGLTAEEAVWAATRGGARALQLDDRGIVAPGAVGDLVVLEHPSYIHLAYRPDAPAVRVVVKRGEVQPASG
jgi:imidazolonepropionase